VRSVFGVDWISVVVERRRLDDDAEGADQRDGGEQPEHESVEHHRHELPVLLHLLTSHCQLRQCNIEWCQ